MSNELEQKPTPNQTVIYQIRLKGHLDSQWTDWFECLTITLEEDGNTLLTGPVADQAALHGLLKKVRDLGMPLVSVVQVQFHETHPYRSEKEIKMNTNRKSAVIVGILFILGFAGAFGPVAVKPILDDPSYLVKMFENKNTVMVGALAQLIMALACAGIAIGLYPILKKHNEALALGAVGFRMIENIFQIVAALALLSMLTLSQEVVKADAIAASAYQAAGASLHAVHFWSAFVLAHFGFCLGALMYYYAFYRSNLIPRWLSGWGIIAILMHLAGAIITMFAQVDPFSTSTYFLSIPIGLNELTLAGWLIVKGFNSSAMASLSAKTAGNEVLSAA
jgi:hypothetical protein